MTPKNFKTLSDTEWDGADLLEIVSRSVSPVVYAKKKELYSSLCNSPILIDAGKLSFWLERKKGKKCYMVRARELGIIWCGDTPSYWDLTSHPDSRFSEVALLKEVCWLEIRGTINTGMLSSHTVYGCYLVFKLDRNSYGLELANAFVRLMNDKVDGDDEILDHFRRENARDRHSRTGEAPVRIGDGLTEIAEVHLQRPTGKSESPGKQNSWGRNYRPHGRRRPSPPPVRIGDGFTKKDEMQSASGSQSGRVAVRRGDGWMEVELGSFYNDRGAHGVVETWLLGREGHQWKSGLIVQGVEFRPNPLFLSSFSNS
ncbi:hypothetical protein SASPL_109329 [Salvia splendens]|uniref:Uncharacterized protein n=1 Tax=Salvia splendens TaxID=180675 RepID=A0A8X8YJU8_SALSN|nr:F-box protein PP2-B11-like [Salvia splendens]KAG6431251.1 hypothetical protein SASPL_109329 [Salvia splendens]